MIRITSYAEAREAMRSRDLRQALYDEGAALMSDVIVNLHGDEHVARRRLENRLFRRDTFAWYETERIPTIVADVLAPAIEAGCAELGHLARRTMMMLSVDVAGVDRPAGTEAEIERLYELMDTMARAATVAHATGDKGAVIDAGNRALAAFADEFYEPSRRRRAALVEDVAAGRLDEDKLPRDVLTTLLRNVDDLDLAPGTILRETAYYPWVGSHSTANQFVHAMHHLLEAIDDDPPLRSRLLTDADLLQAHVHESVRLHPASPVALRIATCDVTLSTGQRIVEGEQVVIEVETANRDPEAVGEEPDEFCPGRERADRVAPWGLSFGHGTHACLGQELAAGVDVATADPGSTMLRGAITTMAHEVLATGARPDPHDPAVLDATTTRQMWGRYPVLLA
ncbi:MAG: cytochrome P450 [Actinomycetota bacterium]